MGTQVEQRSSPNAPPRLMPLVKLIRQARVNKYKLTARETEVFSTCLTDGRWYDLNGALLSGAAAWSATGLGGKLTIIPRVFMTGVVAYTGHKFGAYFGARTAICSCTRQILSLEGSPLRGELLSILQEDYPDHPSLKTDPGRPKSGTKSGDWPEMWERGQDESGRIPRIWQIAERKEILRQDDEADILADPFDLMMQPGVMVDEEHESEGKEQNRVERRRSRMGAKERREYDRSRREQRN